MPSGKSIDSSAITESDARGQELHIGEATTGGHAASGVEAKSVVVDVTDSLSVSETPGAVELFEISTAYFGEVEHSFRLISSKRFV